MAGDETKRSEWAATAVWSWTIVISVVNISLTIRPFGGGEHAGGWGGLLFAGAIILVTAMGALIRVKRPENPIGWLLLINGLGLMLGSLQGQFVPVQDPTIVDYAVLVYGTALTTALMFYPLFLVLFLFPTGQFINRRWRWGLRLPIAVIALLFLATVFSQRLGPAFEDDPWSIPNPIGFLPVAFTDAMGFLWSMSLIGVAVGGVASVVTRYRRSSSVVRTQIRWLLYPGVVFAVSFSGIALNLIPSESIWFQLALSGPFVLIPVAMTVAITRYRLFEIDRLISRTLSYALVAITLSLVFAAGAVWLPTRVLGERSQLFVAASTLVVAALFTPLRIRAQRLVDRRFNRSVFEATAVREQLATTLHGVLTPEELAGVWSDTVSSAFEPERVAVWVRRPGSSKLQGSTTP